MVYWHQHVPVFTQALPATHRRIQLAMDGYDFETALELLAVGKIDVIIGTQRLLQADVRFDDLGLVVVDAKHGVEQGHGKIS